MQILIQNFSLGLILHVIFEKQSFLDTFCYYQLSIFTQFFQSSQLLLIQCKRKALIFELPFSLLATRKSWHFSDQCCVLCHSFCLKKRPVFNAGMELTLIWAILREQRQSQAGQANEEQKVEHRISQWGKAVAYSTGVQWEPQIYPQFTRNTLKKRICYRGNTQSCMAFVLMLLHFILTENWIQSILTF